MKTKQAILIKHYRIMAIRFYREARESRETDMTNTAGLMQELGLSLVNDYGMDWDDLDAIEADVWRKYEAAPAWGY